MSDSTLSAHTGSRLVTRDELSQIAAPPSTATHRPIAHVDLIELMLDRLAASGYHLAKEAYAVQRDGLRLFGTFDLINGETPGEGMGLALGFRHGNDKSLALQIVAGARVFVCDNLALSGEAKVFRSMHTHGVIARLREALGGYVRGLGGQVQKLRDRFTAWSAATLTDLDAKVILYDAIASGLIPGRLRPDVHESYFRAEALGLVDCTPRTKMGLHNAFTRAIKALNPQPAYEANLGLTRLLDTAQPAYEAPAGPLLT